MPFIQQAGAAAPSAAQQQATATGLGDLDSDAFLQLLVAQMRYQDPMSPTDHSAMLQQTSQFTQVEALQRVSEIQQQLLGLSQAGIAADLVGKEVAAVRQDGQEVVGIVHAVRFTQSGPVLQVGDEEVPLQAATQIGLPEAAPAAAADGAAPEPWSGPWSLDGDDSDGQSE